MFLFVCLWVWCFWLCALEDEIPLEWSRSSLRHLGHGSYRKWARMKMDSIVCDWNQDFQVFCQVCIQYIMDFLSWRNWLQRSWLWTNVSLRRWPIIKHVKLTQPGVKWVRWWSNCPLQECAANSVGLNEEVLWSTSWETKATNVLIRSNLVEVATTGYQLFVGNTFLPFSLFLLGTLIIKIWSLYIVW